MLYKITMLAFFEEENKERAKNLKSVLTPFTVFAVNCNEGTDREKISSIAVEKCYHDETPTQACEVIFRWEKGNGIVIGGD